MKKTTKARKYSSPAIDELLDEITPLEMQQTKVKMQLAAKIEDLVKAKNWTNSQFAEKLGKNPSEISKWFSGTQNFTLDILTEIAMALGVGVAQFFTTKTTNIVYKIEYILESPAIVSKNKFSSLVKVLPSNNLTITNYQATATN